MTLIKFKTRIKKKPEAIKQNTIQKAMEAKGITQSEMCRKLKMDKSHLSRIISGQKKNISLPIALKIAKFLEVPVDKLFKI